MKPRHSAEQSTTTVNKSEALGKRGFAVLKDKAKVAEPKAEEKVISKNDTIDEVVSPVATTMPKKEEMNIHISEDPQDKFLCEGCQ